METETTDNNPQAQKHINFTWYKIFSFDLLDYLFYRPDNVIIHVWYGDFGLATIDPKCIEAMILFKAHNIPFRIFEQYSSDYDSLPVVEMNKSFWGVLPALDALVRHQNIVEIDSMIPSDVKYRANNIEIQFFRYFVFPFMLKRWGCLENKVDFLLPWFSGIMESREATLYVHKMSASIRKHVNTMFGNVIDKLEYGSMFVETRIFIKSLNELLRQRTTTYMFSDTITTTDIRIYSYLICAITYPTFDPSIKNLIMNHQPLLDYVNTITQNFYPTLQNHERFKNETNNQRTMRKYITPFCFKLEGFQPRMLLLYVAGQLLSPIIIEKVTTWM